MDTTFKVLSPIVLYSSPDAGGIRNDIPYLKSGDGVVCESVGAGWYKIKDTAIMTSNPALKGYINRYKTNLNGLYIFCSTSSLTKNVKLMMGEEWDGKMVISDKVKNEVMKTRTYDKASMPTIRDTISQINLSLSHVAYTSDDLGTEDVTRTGETLRINNLRGILGIPHQFLPTADPRMNSNRLIVDGLGRMYFTHILKTMPLLYITPGIPEFVPSATLSDRQSLASALVGGGSQADAAYSGKYYAMKFDYVHYFHYVTPMLRLAASWLGIGDITMNDVPLRRYNWQRADVGVGNGGTDGWFVEALKKLVGAGRYTNMFGRDCVVFYANCGENTSDSFSNSITQSGLASTINNLSDSAREFRFMVGSGMAMGGMDTDSFNKEGAGNVQPTSTGLGNFADAIVNKCKAIWSGGRLVFPQIWSDSNFSRSYSCSMKLIAPSGDKLSVFLNILVPIFHILGFAVAKQTDSGGQTYESPFLIRAYYKGMFNVDMGIVENLSITKGTEGEWTVDGLPTVADVTFDIKDMYDGMFISPSMDLNPTSGLMMANITELDYIANCCGINVNQSEGSRINYLMSQFGNGGADLVDDILAGIGQTAANWFSRFTTFG